MPYNSLPFSLFLDDCCKTSTMHSSVYRVHTFYILLIPDTLDILFIIFPHSPFRHFFARFCTPEIIVNYALSKSLLHTKFTGCPQHVIYRVFFVGLPQMTKYQVFSQCVSWITIPQLPRWRAREYWKASSVHF